VPYPFKLSFIDFPGVCDAETEVYDLEVERLLTRYDVYHVSHVTIIIDVEQGLNTVS
jgi:hypothetical protein